MEKKLSRNSNQRSTRAILALRPGRRPGTLDTLAAQFEHMKRWPDLIGALQKRAAVVESPTSRWRSASASPGCSRRSSRNVAEAIKAYEKVLELDRRQRGGHRLPQDQLREAARLGEADRGAPERDRAHHRRPRSAAPRSSRWPSSPRKS